MVGTLKLISTRYLKYTVQCPVVTLPHYRMLVAVPGTHGAPPLHPSLPHTPPSLCSSLCSALCFSRSKLLASPDEWEHVRASCLLVSDTWLHLTHCPPSPAKRPVWMSLLTGESFPKALASETSGWEAEGGERRGNSIMSHGLKPMDIFSLLWALLLEEEDCSILPSPYTPHGTLIGSEWSKVRE